MKHSRTATYVLVGLITLLFLCFSAFALFFNMRGGEDKEFVGRIFAGKVTYVSDTRFRVTDARGVEREFQLRPGTVLLAGKGDVPPERLSEGLFVMIEFVPGTEPLDAYEVRILTTNSLDGFKLHKAR